MPLLLVINELTFIQAAISIDEDTLSVHLVVIKLAREAAPVGPGVLAMALHLIVRKHTIVT